MSFNGKSAPGYTPVARYRLAELDVCVWRCSVSRAPGSQGRDGGGSGRYVALTSGRLPDALDYRFETEREAAEHFFGERIEDARVFLPGGEETVPRACSCGTGRAVLTGRRLSAPGDPDHGRPVLACAGCGSESLGR